MIHAPSALLLALLLACSGEDAPPPGQGEGWAIAHVEAGEVAGLSGLAADPQGRLWAVTERPPRLLRLSPDGTSVAASLPIEGLPEGAEPESLAITDMGAVWVGTEAGGDGRPADLVARLRVEADRAVVDGERPVTWAAFGLTADGNRGLEGLCAAGEALLAAGEPVREVAGLRQAPLASWDAQAASWRTAWLPLRSARGKVSALTCRPGPGGAVVVEAIERHYAVLHLLRATLPPGAPDGLVLEVEALPLPPALRPPRANYEGLERVGDTLLLLSDNQASRVSGPTVLARVQVP